MTTCFEIYQELKGWQTAIGSLLGFVGLIIGALYNFNLNRKRDAAIRSEEALSVAAALYGEILLLRQEVALLANAVVRVYIDSGTQRDPLVIFDNHFVEAYKLSEPFLYKELAPKIGFLDVSLIIGITEFHKNFQEAKTRLPFLIRNNDRVYQYGCGWVLIPACDAVNNVTPTLRRIEQMASIQKPAETPDIHLAEDLNEENQSYE